MDQFIIFVVNFGIGWLIGSELGYWCRLDRSQPIAPQIKRNILPVTIALFIMVLAVTSINPVLKDLLK